MYSFSRIAWKSRFSDVCMAHETWKVVDI